MIELVHMLFGSAVASKFHNPYLAIIFAFLSHYFLDIFPHTEYDIHNIKDMNWKNSAREFTKIIIDFCFGLLLVLFFYKSNPIILIAGFFAILPDGLAFINYFLKTPILNAHDFFHHELLHYFRGKKIPMFWKILSQIVAVIAALLILK